MRKHILISIGILVLIISCKQKETQKVEISKQKETTELKVETENEKIVIQEQYIENYSLLTQLKSDLDKIALNPKFDLKIKSKTNLHDNTVIDTIKTLTFDKTKIDIFRATNWESIYAAKIGNSDFKLLDSINIGAKKQTVESRLNTELITDLVKIGNLEQTSVFIFKFENGVLKSINYEGYVD